MVNFGKKILGLSAAAITFAGMAFGQATCGTATASPNFIRAEGTTELVGTITVTCTSLSAGPLSMQVYLSPQLTVTSKVLSTTTGATEATATVQGTPVNGTIGGNGQVNFSFSGVTASATTVTIAITNIRVNATALTVSSGLPPAITATVFTSGAGVANAGSASAGNVAFAQNGLGGAAVYKSVAAGGAIGAPTATLGSAGANGFTICNSFSTSSPAYVIKVTEGFNTAFKAAAGESAQTPVTVGTTTNAVNSGTRLQLTFANLPLNGLTAYLPTTVTSASYSTGTTPATIQLTSSASGSYSAVSAGTSSTATGIPATTLYGVEAAISVTGGTFTAVYEVTTADPIDTDVFDIPVYFGASANPANASGTSTVAVSFAPIGSTNIPNFTQTSTTSVLPASTFNLCTTSLLFPFVTNASGFDTGLAISNTSTDPFGAAGATPQSGTCTLNFYGPTTNPAAVTSAMVNSGTVYTNLISTLSAGFQGYMIAQCNFQFAHGFAFITDGFGGGGRGLSIGYLAGVIQDPNQVARRSNPAGEVLGN